jgi:hypothetical protein
LGTSNIAQLQALIAQRQRAAHGRHGGAGYGSLCYDGATTVAPNGATGACPPGFGVHQGDRSDDSGSSDGGGSMDSGGGGDEGGGESGGGGDSGGDS